MEKISEEDRLSIELAKSNKKIAELALEKASVQKDLANSYFENFVLQLYMKYNLTNSDSIEIDGSITRKKANNEEQAKTERDQFVD